MVPTLIVVSLCHPFDPTPPRIVGNRPRGDPARGRALPPWRAVLRPDHEAEAGLVAVDRPDLVVDETDREAILAHVGFLEVRSQRRGLFRPRHPKAPVRVQPQVGPVEPAPQLGLGAYEGNEHVERSLTAGFRRSCTPAGSGCNKPSKWSGAAKVATIPPSLIPSFLGSGVPEYPADAFTTQTRQTRGHDG